MSGSAADPTKFGPDWSASLRQLRVTLMPVIGALLTRLAIMEIALTWFGLRSGQSWESEQADSCGRSPEGLRTAC